MLVKFYCMHQLTVLYRNAEQQPHWLLLDEPEEDTVPYTVLNTDSWGVSK
jgi:hypothetical protein